jgi:hypothetical protein
MLRKLEALEHLAANLPPCDPVLDKVQYIVRPCRFCCGPQPAMPETGAASHQPAIPAR